MITHTGEKEHKCVECGHLFGRVGHLKHHLLTHSGKKLHTCLECKKSFGEAGTLRMHMITHTEERVHKCAECGDSFVQAAHVKTHMLTHSGEKLHMCTQCIFRSRPSERSHQNIFLTKAKRMQMVQLHFNHKITYQASPHPLWREATQGVKSVGAHSARQEL